MTRIHILGPPGSGKSTLAQRLATSLHIPYYELDYVAWEQGFPGTDRPLETRLRDIQQIATQPAWVTEGIFLHWTDELLQTADHIVWLDLSLPLTVQRIIMRRFRWTLEQNDTPPSSLFKQLELLRYIGAYYFSKRRGDTRRFTVHHLQSYESKLTRCYHPDEVERFFKGILEQAQTYQRARISVQD